MSIGTIKTGDSFGGVLKYAEEKEGGQLLDTNLAGGNWNARAAEMDAMASGSARCQKPVFHVSMSAPDGEHPSDDQWRTATRSYMREMGFSDDHQYALVKHSDRDHDHVHLIVKRVGADGRAVSMSNNYERNKVAMRAAEREASMQRFEAGKSNGKGRLVELRAQIDKAAEGSPSLEVFKSRCRSCGLDVIENRSSGTGRLSGLSFQAKSDGKVWKGSEIGRGYSLNGLQKKGLRLEAEKHPLLKNHKPQPIQPSATSNRILSKMGAPSLPTPRRLLTKAIKAAIQL